MQQKKLMQRKPWSDAVVARLTKLHKEQRHTLAEIAKMLSQEFSVRITRDTLLAKMRRLGLRRDKPQHLIKRSMVLQGLRVSIEVSRDGGQIKT